MICTIATRSELRYAQALANSFLDAHPQGAVRVLLLDHLDEEALPAADGRLDLIPLGKLEGAAPRELAFRFGEEDLRRAVTPLWLSYLTRHYGRQGWFIDCRSLVFERLDPLFAALESRALLLVPRGGAPLPVAGGHSDDLELLEQGLYREGLIGFNADQPRWNEILDWWGGRMINQEVRSRRALERWRRTPDLLPTLFPEAGIWFNPSAGLNRHNFGRWTLRQERQGYRIGHEPLRLAEFRGMTPKRPPRPPLMPDPNAPDETAGYAALLRHYGEALGRAGPIDAPAPYALDQFDNGIPIPEIVREIWRDAHVFGLYWPDPANTAGEDSFFHWLNRPADAHSDMMNRGDQGSPQRTEETIPVTNLAIRLYNLRPELRRRFPEPLYQDRYPFACWFAEQASQQYGLHESFVAPVQLALEQRLRIQIRAQWLRLRYTLEVLIYEAYQSQSWLYRLYKGALGFISVPFIEHYLERVVTRRISRFGPLLDKTDLAPRHLGEATRAEHGVNIVALLREDSSMGRHGRQVMEALHQGDLPLAKVCHEGEPRRQLRRVPPLFSQIPDGNPHFINLFYMGAGGVNWKFALGGRFFAGRYNIYYIWWELERFPREWLYSLRAYDEFWVGSDFVRDALARITSVPVVRINLPVHPIPLPGLGRAELGLPEDRHIFLFVFDARSSIERKNPMAVVEAYRRAFAGREHRTLLVIKSQELARYPKHHGRIRESLDELGGVLIDRSMKKVELDALFHACDTYVSLHRSEGFGATIAEAMIIGKPVIATAYSGNLDFMTEENSYPVPYQLVELTENTGQYPEGSHWAEANVEAAARWMRHVVEHPDEAQQRGRRAKETMEGEYSLERVTAAMRSRIEQIYRHYG